jgi:hypothetical protein
MEALNDSIGKDYMSKEWMAVQGSEVRVQGPQVKESRSGVNKKLSGYLFLGWVEGAAEGEVALG